MQCPPRLLQVDGWWVITRVEGRSHKSSQSPEPKAHELRKPHERADVYRRVWLARTKPLSEQNLPHYVPEIWNLLKCSGPDKNSSCSMQCYSPPNTHEIQHKKQHQTINQKKPNKARIFSQHHDFDVLLKDQIPVSFQLP